MPSIAENLAAVLGKISDVAVKYGRKPEEVRLLAVSKTFPAEDVAEAFRAGQLCFGENRTAELEIKVPQLPAEISWHLIGHLQSNKAVKAVRYASWIHSVDSEKLLRKLDHAAEEEGKQINILLEVNLSGEESKSGVRGRDEAVALAETALSMCHLSFRGLMTMAEFGAGETRIRETFAGLRTLRDAMEQKFGILLPELSMGMSGDFEYAIAEGATIVRIGTAVFGNRG